MPPQAVSLIGELFVAQESSASQAISYAKKGLQVSTEVFEQFFKAFGLTIEAWDTPDVEWTEEGFYVQIEAKGKTTSTKQALLTFIQNNQAELYFNVNGFAPTSIR